MRVKHRERVAPHDLRYTAVSMGKTKKLGGPMKAEKQRRHPGVWLVVDDDFKENLLELRKTKTQTRIAHELGLFMGTKVDHANISRMESGETKASVLVYPMCQLYGWPVPAVADAPKEVADLMGALMEVQADPDELERTRSYILAALTTSRLRRRKRE